MTRFLDGGFDLTAGPFVLLSRPGLDPGRVELLTGDIHTVGRLRDIEIPTGPPADRRPTVDAFVMVPYRQIAERGFDRVDDGTPLLAMSIDRRTELDVDALARSVETVAITCGEPALDVDDGDYEDLVQRIIDDEIGTGVGANFVLSRAVHSRIERYGPAVAVKLFCRLVRQETGAYWTFLAHTGERTLIGASPERHLSLRDGTATMNPISGTYRYPASGPSRDGVLDFLADEKEANELYMVLDEELKMMARLCGRGGEVVGPFLKRMSSVAHTEYLINGATDRDPRTLLEQTMFAPTVVGSPLESACRVVRRYEPAGRGYYAGVMALVGRGGDGRPVMDSAIAIRTAEIGADGDLRLRVGATIVRDSSPAQEAAETRAKAAGLLRALGVAELTDARPDHVVMRGARRPRVSLTPWRARSTGRRRRAGMAEAASLPRTFGPGRLLEPDLDREVIDRLAQRNRHLSRFWLTAADRRHDRGGLSGRALVIDAEDTFTAMIAHQVASLGLSVTVTSVLDGPDPGAADLVVLGPGPGDPTDGGDERVAGLRSSVETMLADGTPFLAVCLSHQVVSHVLGLPVRPRPRPNQGVQRSIPLFGADARVGFYNTFSAYADGDRLASPVAGEVDVARDKATGEVFALRGRSFCSTQFHPESVLTEDGDALLAEMIRRVLPGLRGPNAEPALDVLAPAGSPDTP
jgi:phenazine biosynthesis protein phzE